jgi:Spy/CpxP family protein refolding chaperone
MKGFTLGFMILMLAATGTVAYAQKGPSPMQPGSQYDDDMDNDSTGRPGRGRPMSEKKRVEIRKKVEAVRIWRLTEALKLDANTSAKLSPLLSSFDQQRQAIQQEQMETMRALRLTLKSSQPDEAKLRSLLEKAENSRRAMQNLRGKEIIGLKDILSIEQQARFLIFQQDFQREMRGMISGVRGRGKEAGSVRPPDK